MGTDAHPASRTARESLKAAISNGVFAPGLRLPGERALAARLSVSRQTLRQALNQLAEEGVLRPSPQRGWYVTGDVVSEPPNVLQSFTDMARARGLTPGSTVLDSSQRPVRLDEAERLRLAPASPVLEVRRLRTLDTIPVAVDHAIVALGRAPELADADLTDASLYGTLEKICGVTVTRSDYLVRADGADAETAALLGIEPGAPILVGEELTFDLTDTPILTGHLAYRGDAYRFQATLFRPAQD